MSMIFQKKSENIKFKLKSNLALKSEKNQEKSEKIKTNQEKKSEKSGKKNRKSQKKSENRIIHG